jgi:Fe-S oxidoreductase
MARFAAAQAAVAFGKKKKREPSGSIESGSIRSTSQTLAVGCPFCMTQMEDALKSRSLEESMRVRDLSELIAESAEAAAK